ncbi:MAG: FAD-binding oxidoreductase [Afipia sp.]|nr:FAD-binding oxidoreductase [Afipia sp.]
MLAVLGDGWRKLAVHPGAGQRVTLGPANIVANVNKALKPFNRKIGPDPASQATCKIGGVVNNNSSGMCCGVAYNTYHTMARLRVMLVDGTVLDSGDPASVAAFRVSHAELLVGISTLHHEVTADAELVALIRKKYRIKNTVGYSINALVDFHDPIDILIHLIVGSEGTLGFVSEVTYNTIPEHPYKVTGLIPFPDPHSCGRAITQLANGGVQQTHGVTSAEYLERRALAAVEHLPVMQPYLRFFTETSPAMLVDVTAESPEELAKEESPRRRRSLRRKVQPISTSPMAMRSGAPALGHAQGLHTDVRGDAAQGHDDADRGCGRAGGAAGRFRHRYAEAPRRLRLFRRRAVRPRAGGEPPFPDGGRFCQSGRGRGSSTGSRSRWVSWCRCSMAAR